jgi:signal transduction histidine kinase
MAGQEPEADPNLFADAELMEFSGGEPLRALEEYRRLAASPNPAIRAGALVREARVLRNTGRERESRAVYSVLAGIRGVTVGGAPADLAARCALGDPSIKEDLLRGKWALTRGQFEFYWSQAADGARLPRSAPPAGSAALTEAAVLAGQSAEGSGSGQRTAWIGGEPFFLLWRNGTVLVTKPGRFIERIGAGIGDGIGEDLAPGASLRVAAADADGHIVYGQRSSPGSSPSRGVVRAAAETQLPWTLYLSSAQQAESANLAAGQRFLLFGTSAMVAFMLLAAYFIARAMRREAETARMQSDFVSAVSHEFRSPLTSLRQLSEMLAQGRVPAGERRQLYYETLVRETTRLQRLVEGLLHFGRMEAGARPYRFEELDAGKLVERVVSEMMPQAAGLGRRIEASGAGEPCLIEADQEAIAVALRNLLDNALKYSPGEPVVWVEWEARDIGMRRAVAIRVRDKGLGIAAPERKAIFRRFVRGAAAQATNSKGSGLGLAMVQHIVAAHGGRILVASQPGVGSEFTMLLPQASLGAHNASLCARPL